MESVMGMFAKAFFIKAVFASFVIAALSFATIPYTAHAAPGAGIGNQSGMTGTYQTQASVAESARSTSNRDTGPDFGCTYKPSTWFNKCVLSLFYNTVASPISWALGVVATLFNFAFNMSMDAGAMEGSSASIFESGFIIIGWRAIRDLINITFIFALLQVSIFMIVGKSSGYQDRLKNIIIAAVFINFSFFIVTEAIKISNAFTQAIYNQVILKDTNIADAFTTATGISAFGTQSEVLTTWAASPQHWSLLIYLIFASILMIVFIGILLMSTAMFVSRYVVLILCVVFSPALFIGLIWPQFEEKAKEIKQTLIGQLLFPIIYLLFIWVGLNFINIEKTAQSVLSVTDKGQLISFNAAAQEIVFRFCVASALFITALTAAKSYSQMGSKNVSRLQGYVGKGIGAVAFGGAAMAGRTAVGGFGGSALQSVGARLQSVQGSDKAGFVGGASRALASGVRAVGRGTSLAGDKARTASFDVRSGTVFQTIGKESGIADMYGKGREGGIAKAQEERAERLKKRRDELKATTAAESAALNRAAEKQAKDTKVAEDAFKAQHGTSLEDHKKKIEELKNTQKELKAAAQNERSKKQNIETETAKIRQLHVDNLKSQREALAAGPQNQATQQQLAQLGRQINQIQNKRTSSADIAAMGAGFADLHAQVKAQEELQSIIATKEAEARAEGQKIYAETQKMAVYEATKSAIDKEFEATEKSIKSGGKARAGSFDKSLAVKLHGKTVNQAYFAKLREEAAKSGNKKK